MGSRYKSNAELKAAVQKRLKRKITDDEWEKYGSIDDSPRMTIRMSRRL